MSLSSIPGRGCISLTGYGSDQVEEGAPWPLTLGQASLCNRRSSWFYFWRPLVPARTLCKLRPPHQIRAALRWAVLLVARHCRSVPGKLCGSIAAHERRQQLRPLWQQLSHSVGVPHEWVLRLRRRIHALPRGMRGFVFLFQRQFQLRQLRELVLDWRELLWRDLSQEYLIVASFVRGGVRVFCESGD